MDKGYESEDEYLFYFIPKDVSPDTAINKPKPVCLKVESMGFIKDVKLSPYIGIRVANEICDLIKDRYRIVMQPSSLKING